MSYRTQRVFWCITSANAAVSKVALGLTTAHRPSSLNQAAANLRFRIKRWGCFLLYAVLLATSSSIGAAFAQTKATPTTSAVGTDPVVIRFAPPTVTSIRDQYVNTNVFQILVERWANRSPDVRTCNVRLQVSDPGPNLELITRPANPNRRVDCLRSVVAFMLHGTISDSDVEAARSAAAEAAASWTNPHPRYATLANFASERLAYLAIYQTRSLLHELYSIAEADYTSLSPDTFRRWIDQSRSGGLSAVGPSPNDPELLGLGVARQSEPVSLSSARFPAGTLFYEGERFGVAALIMLHVPADYRLNSKPFWNRFSCNRSPPTSSHGAAAADSISSITCFSHQVFASDAWLGFAIRKDERADYARFCEEVNALANDTDLASLARDMSQDLYVLLPLKCDTKR